MLLVHTDFQALLIFCMYLWKMYINGACLHVQCTYDLHQELALVELTTLTSYSDDLYLFHADTTSAGSVLWKPVESTGQRISSIAGTSLGVESMQQESSAGGSDDSPSTTPSTSPRSMGGSSPVVSTTAAGFRVRSKG